MFKSVAVEGVIVSDGVSFVSNGQNLTAPTCPIILHNILTNTYICNGNAILLGNICAAGHTGS